MTAKVKESRHTEQALACSTGRGNVAEAVVGGDQVPQYLTFVQQNEAFFPKYNLC